MKYTLDMLTQLDAAERERLGVVLMPSEIRAQAGFWLSSAEEAFNKMAEVRGLIQLRSPRRVVFSGAGSSGYVGRCLVPLFRSTLRMSARVCDTTDVVVDPEGSLLRHEPCLVVLFARSGDSPESLATYEIARSRCSDVRFLAITCNPNGGLARLAENRPLEVSLIMLDGRTNDKSLAMTSSFTNMVIAGQALAFMDEPDVYRQQVAHMADCAEQLMQNDAALSEIAEMPFRRAVFLGDGALFGAAQESALKVMELTDGAVMTMSQTFLGVRHGPKAVIDEQTLVVFYVSGDPYKAEYEFDLIDEITRENVAMKTVAIAPRVSSRISERVDYTIAYGRGSDGDIADELRPPVDVIAGQLLGLYKSLNLSLKPDTPSARGVISRVVKGVRIHELT